MRNRSEYITASILVALIVGSVTTGILTNRSQRAENKPHIRGMVELGTMIDTSRALVAGFNCHILRKYADDNNSTAEIRLVPKGESYLDSLKLGVIDVLVLPFLDSMGIQNDSLISSTPLDSMSVWYTNSNDRHWMKQINEWIREWHDSEDYLNSKDIYLENYSPFKKSRTGALSPYDDIMKEKADSLGLDWRLICAIAYKESRFHIELKSNRGASGIMQIMPNTGRSMGASDLSDPEQSIDVAARYLKHLFRIYRRIDSPQERRKFVLAAYNAGEGRIQDCLNYARFKGVDHEKWDNITALFPEMSDSTIVANCDAIKLGTFKGIETEAYVRQVNGIYQRFCTICPEK
ncbi:MAG: transglycosylase SLT domain-containing protein [Bacteroidales bacterium]|nr:transglycosylase SLT domain-containing protein [Candidatus Cryptobacteroides equifaecalis]